MGLFSKKKADTSKRVIGDSMDLDSFTNYDNVGWKIMSDTQDYDSLHNEIRHKLKARLLLVAN